MSKVIIYWTFKVIQNVKIMVGNKLQLRIHLIICCYCIKGFKNKLNRITLGRQLHILI